MSVRILQGDCREVMRGLDEACVDAIVTDPPYELCFMGKGWDSTGVANDPETWRQALRVLKPGGYLMAFSGTRTYHRMVCAIEDAGFEIRDQIGWAFGSGFPKSHNGPWGGTALKPAWEPICMARKPLIGTVAANVLAHGTGGLNIDGCRVPTTDDLNGGAYSDGNKRPEDASSMLLATAAGAFVQPTGRWPANLIHDGSDEVLAAFPDTGPSPKQYTKTKAGWLPPGSEHAANSLQSREFGDTGSAARFFYSAKASKSDRNSGLDGHETVIIEWSKTLESPEWGNADRQVKLQVDTALSPPKVIDVSGAPRNNATEWSTLLFGSDRTALCQSDSTCIIETKTSSTTGLTTLSYFQSSLTRGSIRAASCATGSGGSPAPTAGSGTLLLRTTSAPMASALGAEPVASPTLLRISASARRSDHPTVKPTDLMRYLCRLVTPAGGVVLDPFMGSGSTLKAAELEGFSAIGIELQAEYIAIARRRIASDAPLFAEVA